MPIYEVDTESIKRLKETSFHAAGFEERSDLQRLLREKINVVAPDVLVIEEEFGEWTESRRRIDLLGVDKDANLVVIELKRTEDGGHMELQAVRYAAMVSTLTIGQAVDIFRQYLATYNQEVDPEQALLEFLEWDELDEERFGQDVRIVLVSAGFSRELTTAVLWLNEKGLDIRCVRIQPYDYDGRTLVDVQQVIPLPETVDYQVQVREKKRREQVARRSGPDFTRYDVTVGGEKHPAQWKRNAILLVVKALHASDVPLFDIQKLFLQLGHGKAFLVIEQETEEVEEFLSLAASALEARGETYNNRRWHTAPGDLMVSNGQTFALANQWGGKRWLELMEVLQRTYPEIRLEYVSVADH